MTIDLVDETWNDDIFEDIEQPNYDSVIVFSRDWTVETIFNQISQGNIELNPKFQRRNAWNDEKRSRLIESLILGIPVPEIVLAEDPEKKKSFIVIDGKQRLLTVAGFINPIIDYWLRPKLSSLKGRKDLNGLTYDNLKSDMDFQNEFRALMNADIRCTIISNYESNDILYDIFYRLNTGSVPLSTQELRQVLNKGDFADALIERTNHPIPLHDVLNLEEPDPRLRDIEVMLRSIALELYGSKYRGNLKKFLDDSMKALSSWWEKDKGFIEDLFQKFDQATRRAINVLDAKRVGRKYVDGKWESRFNKSVFEVELYYFWRTQDERINNKTIDTFVKGFELLCDKNVEFRSSVEATTKTNENYQKRFSLIKDIFNSAFNLTIEEIPVKVIEG